MVRPRVFVSSVMEQYSECREAARRAIEAVEAEPVMAEDFPSRGASSRNACLDAVASCDVFLMIIGTRGGWRAPSGRLVVEEECDEARRLNKIISAYIQRVERDSDAQTLVEEISDYVTGHYRISFSTCTDLEGVMNDRLREVLQPLRLPVMDPNDATRRAGECREVQGETTVRLVLAPERLEEIIDRIEIGEKEFEERVQRITHATRFFNYRSAKSVSLRQDTLVIEQAASRRDADRCMEIEATGILTFDAVVSARGDDPIESGLGYMYTLVRGDVAAALDAAFHSAGRLYAEIDAYLRHQRFNYAAAFCGIGFRSLADALPKGSRGFSMARDIRRPLIVEKSRLIGRQVLDAPESEVARLVKLLGRAIEAES